MSLTVFGSGRVAHGNLGPIQSMETRERNGAQVQEPFRRCHVFVTDRFATPRVMEDGSTRPASQMVQLIFNSGPRHEKVFGWLRAGRQISFRGQLSHRPRVEKLKDQVDEQGQPRARAHANPVIYVEQIDFLDQPVEAHADRFLQALVDGNKIPAEKKIEMREYLKTAMTARPVSAVEGEVVNEADPFE